MCALLRGLRRLSELLSPGKRLDSEETAAALARVPPVLQDARQLVEQQFESLRLVEDCLAVAEENVGRAWAERERMVRNYFEVLRGVLAILDQCAVAEVGPIDARPLLEQLLRQQKIEPIEVSIGDSFDPQWQCCEESEPSPEHPPGTVLRILEAGYRQGNGGLTTVVRPARVVVSKAEAP